MATHFIQGRDSPELIRVAAMNKQATITSEMYGKHLGE
jgi:hypothetical protein